jgi:hypothetical protein
MMIRYRIEGRGGIGRKRRRGEGAMGRKRRIIKKEIKNKRIKGWDPQSFKNFTMSFYQSFIFYPVHGSLLTTY